MKILYDYLTLGFLAVILSLAVVQAGSAYAATGAITVAELPATVAAGIHVPAIRLMTDGEKQATGCILSATAAMAATYAIGPSEMIMLVVGGLVVPSSSQILFIGLMGTMASMACGAGALITPAVLWALR
ncbi:MAG: hypothetical protein WCK65_07730 [Rhodospirillaceae bacterium]